MKSILAPAPTRPPYPETLHDHPAAPHPHLPPIHAALIDLGRGVGVGDPEHVHEHDELVRAVQLPSDVPTDPVNSPPTLPTGGPPPDPNANSGPQSSAQLYLYTFLATLILLLGVCRALAAAAAPPPPHGRGGDHEWDKPRLWDAYLAPPVNVPVGSGGGGGGEGEKDEWTAIMHRTRRPRPRTPRLPLPPPFPPLHAHALPSTSARQRKLTKWQSSRTGGSRAGAAARARHGAHRHAYPAPPSSASSSNSHQLSPPTPHTPSSPQAAGGRTSEPQRPTWVSLGVGLDTDGEPLLPQLEVGVVGVGVGVVPSAEGENEHSVSHKPGLNLSRRSARSSARTRQSSYVCDADDIRNTSLHDGSSARWRSSLGSTGACEVAAIFSTMGCFGVSSTRSASVFHRTAARVDRHDRQGTRLAPCIPTPHSVFCELLREGVRYRGSLSLRARPPQAALLRSGNALGIAGRGIIVISLGPVGDFYFHQERKIAAEPVKENRAQASELNMTDGLVTRPLIPLSERSEYRAFNIRNVISTFMRLAR
ncbi:hypothetical protein DFH09DRAFT_1110515 [Mycena vulgaris]|nr:hypothetical protein DFH09DRAFT_1110515 [Mycena vulgaris]